MNKDKQIEEMAKTMCAYYGTEKCYDCRHCCDCNIGKEANRLYNAGYRKADEVAEELERYLRVNEDIALKCKEENGEQNREYWKGKLSAFKQIRGFIDTELKKKYKENKGE